MWPPSSKCHDTTHWPIPSWSIPESKTTQSWQRRWSVNWLKLSNTIFVTKTHVWWPKRVAFNVNEGHHLMFPVRTILMKMKNGDQNKTYAYINSWCLPIMQCIHENQGIKLITSGVKTINISFYISLYVVKHQANSSNVSALLAKNSPFIKDTRGTIQIFHI